jgi:hypothetical protein
VVPILTQNMQKGTGFGPILTAATFPDFQLQ